MKLAIGGAGAIGGAVGAYLIRAGHSVHFVDVDRDHVAAILAQILEIEAGARSRTTRTLDQRTTLVPSEATA